MVRELSVQNNACLSASVGEVITHRETAKKAFALFKRDPFDVRLRTHKIHHLSSLYKKTIYAVRVEGDLRSIFYLEGEIVVSVDMGTHAIYQS